MLNILKSRNASIGPELKLFLMRGQLRTARAMVLFCLFVTVAQLVFIFSGPPQIQGRPDPAVLLILPLICLCVGICEWIYASQIQRHLEKKREMPAWQPVVMALAEACLPSVGVILMHLLFGWEEALRSPPVCGYYIMLMVSVHRLDARLTLLMGLFEVFSLGAILGYALRSGEISPLQMRFSVSFIVLILVATAVAVFTIRLLRRLLRDLVESQRNQQKAEAIIWEKDRLMAILGHDLRAPLNGVAGLAELMARAPEQFTAEEIRRYAGEINVTSRHLRELVENLMEWAQLRTGQASVAPISCSLTEQVSAVFTVHAAAARIKEISYTIDISEELNIMTDPRWLRTILRNLLSNAVKFTPNGGNISIAAFPLPDAIELTVRNSGSQFPANLTAELSRGVAVSSQPGTNREEGTGIGLLLCLELAERLEGSLVFRNNEDEAEVTLTVPGQDGNSRKEAQKTQKERISSN